jgi:hypothetical protein
VRAEIERQAKRARIGDAATSHARARFKQRHTRLGGTGTAGGGDAGGTRSHDNKVDIGIIGAGMHGGRGDQRGGTGKKRAAAKPRHGIRMIDAERRQIARTRVAPQISWSRIRNASACGMNQIAMSLH